MNNSKKIVAIFAGEGGISNVVLLKDCGLVPYFMYKNYNADAAILTTNSDNYTYLETYVKGLKLHFLENGTCEEKKNYIKSNFSEIDCLLFQGPYNENLYLGCLYKQLKPEGKIYMALDANSAWMDRIDFYNDSFRRFMENCDVIATSCRAMQKHLNEKWPWKIEYISNGYINYYEYHNQNFTFDFNKKENVIITVGRNGTDQKRTDILLEAFALIADKIPDWELKIIGSVEQEFEEFIENYCIKYPEIGSRVHFRGHITDKITLFNEYAKSKIFALSSDVEGGTPNVIAEALFNGNAIAIRSIVDSYDEAVCGGKCGMAAMDDSTQAYADVLAELCLDDDLEEKCRYAHEYAKRNFDMSKNVDRIYEMLFGGL